MRSETELLELGFAFVDENSAWPRVVDIPSTTAIRRAFGSFSCYKYALIEAYIEKNGSPEWDVKGPAPQRVKNTLAREAVADTIHDAISRIGSFPRTKTPRKRKSRMDVAEMHLVISDVHVGSYSEASMASNMSEGYNINTFRQCADTLEERIEFFKGVYDNGFNINKLVVNFIGDIVDGEAIFLGQALQVDRIITEQVVEASHRFASMFSNWGDAFNEVEIFCVPGNHGRIGKKNELHWRSNLDYLAYLFVQQKLSNQKNIKMHISRSPNMIVQHGETNWLLHHGDFVKGGGNGSYVPYERKMRALSSMGNIPIHFSVSGHYHTSMSTSYANSGRVITNGSFPGPNEFSVNVCNSGNTASQRAWLFSPKKGVIHSENDIYLADRISLAADADRIFTEHE